MRATRLLAALDFLLRPKALLRRREGAAVVFDLFEATAAADGDAHERLFRHVHGYLRLSPQALVQEPQESAASRQDHPPIHDIRGELRRGSIQGVANRRHYRVHRNADRLPDLVARYEDRLGQTRNEVPTPYLRRLFSLIEPERATQLYLQLLGGLRADG